jgi:hypothetical protein
LNIFYKTFAVCSGGYRKFCFSAFWLADMLESSLMSHVLVFLLCHGECVEAFIQALAVTMVLADQSFREQSDE